MCTPLVVVDGMVNGIADGTNIEEGSVGLCSICSILLLEEMKELTEEVILSTGFKFSFLKSSRISLARCERLNPILWFGSFGAYLQWMLTAPKSSAIRTPQEYPGGPVADVFKR